jgi:hypothetical protein
MSKNVGLHAFGSRLLQVTDCAGYAVEAKHQLKNENVGKKFRFGNQHFWISVATGTACSATKSPAG